MRLKTLLKLNSVVGAGSALTAILFGEKVLSMYGVDSNPAASLMGQYSALGTIAMALVAWFVRNVEDRKAQSAHNFSSFREKRCNYSDYYAHDKWSFEPEWFFIRFESIISKLCL